MLVWPFLAMENEEVMTVAGTVETVGTVGIVGTGININLPRLEL